MNGIVYSTEHGRMCPECSRPVVQCICRQKNEVPPGNGTVRVGRQTQGRQGKGVTVITGVPLASDELKKLVRELKARFGSGGTLKEGVIEIQGDHRDVVIAVLEQRGWSVKRSGG